MKTFALLFGLRMRVSRAPYIRWGLSLAVFKFAIDTAVVGAFTHKMWSPMGYVVPSLILRTQATGDAPGGMYVLLSLLALPFLWIGLSMSVRRAADAGLSPWFGTLFVFPVVNYAVIAYLSFAPSRDRGPVEGLDAGHLDGAARATAPQAGSTVIGRRQRAAIEGTIASIGLGLPMVWLTVYGLGSYGMALFFLTPFAMGAASAAIYNRDHRRPLGSTIVVALAGVFLTGLALSLFAIEGILCLGMAMPIAMVVSIFGAMLGRAVVVTRRTDGVASSALVLMLPGFAFAEARFAAPTAREVRTSIEIEAPPEAVWPHVIGFADLDEPPAWFLRLGIAYPMRARITGEGVGAVRRCEFSTGAFVEPITAWAPPVRLAFDVTAQPPSMTEWSPYGAIRTPHLEGYMVSKGGEFDLVRLPHSRTRLEGTTHYTLAIYPDLYWTPYAELVLHAIHRRVLQHIKKLSEAPVVSFNP